MKPNEIIGVSAFIGVFCSLIVFAITLNYLWLGALLVCGVLQIIFLSWWGLTTFNDWVSDLLEKHKKNVA